MEQIEPLDEFIRRTERLAISDEVKSFLIGVRRQFDLEVSAAQRSESAGDEPRSDQ